MGSYLIGLSISFPLASSDTGDQSSLSLPSCLASSCNIILYASSTALLLTSKAASIFLEAEFWAISLISATEYIPLPVPVLLESVL